VHSAFAVRGWVLSSESEYNASVGKMWGIVSLASLALVAMGCGRTAENGEPSADGAEGGTSSTAEAATARSTDSSAVSAAAGGVVGTGTVGDAGGVSSTTGAAGAPGEELACDAPDLASPERWAERLERLLWGSDGSTLTSALATGELTLSGPEAVQEQAEAMLADAERGRVGLPAFVKTWFELDETRLEMSDEMLASTLESTDRTLNAMIFDEGAPLNALFSGDWAVVDARLAEFYGAEAPDGAWGRVTLPEPRQVGLLGQHFWLNATAHPARRGMVLSTALNCVLIPPPPNISPVRDNVHATLTRREEYLISVATPVCEGCHVWIAPLGLTFEHFDGWGEYRTEDNGSVVDASGGSPGTEIEVDDARELGRAFAEERARETAQCAARNVVAYALGESGYLRSSVFDELECFERLNPDLEAASAESFLEWLVTVVRSPVFLAEYPE